MLFCHRQALIGKLMYFCENAAQKIEGNVQLEFGKATGHA